jgi:paraquat-inducible protein B
VSARSHPRLVGAFVLGAISLALGAVVVLSSGGWLEHRDRFTVFFPGSVSGLNPGSPVTFRGVRIGEVVNVKPILTGRSDDPIQIEVVLEFAGDVVDAPPGVPNPYRRLASPDLARLLIDRGVRGRLVSQSLLTGQKAIDFDFLPDQPARFTGVHPRYPELPTTPTAFELLSARFDRLSEKLAELPLDQMLEDVRRVILAVREVVDSEETRRLFASARRAADEVDETLRDVRSTLADAREAIKHLDHEVGSVGQESREALRELKERLDKTQGALDALEATLRGADETRMDVSETLSNVEQAMNALRNLVDYIQTHPEAVIQGKEPGKEKR